MKPTFRGETGLSLFKTISFFKIPYFLVIGRKNWLIMRHKAKIALCCFNQGMMLFNVPLFQSFSSKFDRKTLNYNVLEHFKKLCF